MIQGQLVKRLRAHVDKPKYVEVNRLKMILLHHFLGFACLMLGTSSKHILPNGGVKR